MPRRYVSGRGLLMFQKVAFLSVRLEARGAAAPRERATGGPHLPSRRLHLRVRLLARLLEAPDAPVDRESGAPLRQRACSSVPSGSIRTSASSSRRPKWAFWADWDGTVVEQMGRHGWLKDPGFLGGSDAGSVLGEGDAPA